MSDDIDLDEDLEEPYQSPWSVERAEALKAEYYKFRKHVWLNSKEIGPFCLGNHTYRSQKILIDGVFDALAHDIHHIKVLKSRQLGISSESRALTTFWVGMNDGLQGYMIFDTDGNKEKARLELIAMIKNLPLSYNFPRIKRENRYLVELSNGSVVNFAAAGVKASRSSGTLGRSSGVNFYHRSELCSYENTEGMEAFANSIAEDFPNRLYIDESTARGYNMWNDIWEEAKKDPRHMRCIFIGWWAKDNQIIRKSDPDFEIYGTQAPTEKELKKIRLVEKLYGWKITLEQLAWVRRKMDPLAKQEGDAPTEYEGSTLRLQEQPWVEEDAWQMTESVFFEPEKLTDIASKHASNRFKTYSYTAGIEFTDCRIYPAHNAKSVELKVWEEPVPESYYVISADPAFGENEKNDRSAVQVMRCYADGLDQVAEYAWPLITTKQFAWVIASLLGWYAGEKNEVYFILELNGPGESVWNELQSLKRQLQQGYQPKEVDEKGLRNIFQNVRHFLYSRSDSMTPGRSYHWKTTPRLKVTLMERLRDFVSNGMIHIRSLDTLREMQTITRSGDKIEAMSNKKDDRVVSLAFAVRCWEERVRRILMVDKRTRSNDEVRRRLTIQDQVKMYNTHQLDQFFATKRAQNAMAQRQAIRAGWRNGGRRR